MEKVTGSEYIPNALCAESFQQGCFPSSLRSVLLSFWSWIITNKMWKFRPISLLNSDSKISAKALARRLCIRYGRTPSKDQNGVVKNHQGFHNVRRVLILPYSHLMKRVEWSYFKCLRDLGLGTTSVNGIRYDIQTPLQMLPRITCFHNLLSFFRGRDKDVRPVQDSFF